jgi:hypothetical protein
MSWDLIHRDVLTDKTPAEVTDLLGEPDMKETPGTTWYYNLGHEKYEWQIGPSGAVLAVDFRDGKVVRVRKVVH